VVAPAGAPLSELLRSVAPGARRRQRSPSWSANSSEPRCLRVLIPGVIVPADTQLVNL